MKAALMLQCSIHTEMQPQAQPLFVLSDASSWCPVQKTRHVVVHIRCLTGTYVHHSENNNATDSQQSRQ